MNYREQDNNYPKAFAATGLILGVFLALSYFIVFHNAPKEEDGTGGILVNYGTVDEGMGDDYMSTEEPSVAENANKSAPDKVTPTPPTEEKVQADNSDKNVVTQNNEDAPEVTANTKNPSPTVSTSPNKTESKPVVNQNALYKGATNNGTGNGDGTGNTPGNQGKTTGTTLTNNYDGTGSGNGGNALTARNFVRPPSKPDVGNRYNGKVVVEFRIDKSGNVIYAKAGARGTTIVDYDLLEKCEQAVMNAKVSPSAGASDVQTYTQTFVFKAK
ncbi:energy transducer TonB [Mucilaginibacter limnophilus]|uniref:Energy transducer TonB n=1 Tax=Mucilaginibacter limnophilus TaxID=1932778 RepID=A0A3S2WWW8_9SPHI|nr:energy transducer TonB [Mucilaginibacter limnophilus]RVT99828.1 energy transducer TonB [Mucilaginibacter limnophilus]